VIVTPTQAKKILNGKLEELIIHQADLPEAGSREPVHELRFGERHLVCTVKVIDSWPLEKGGFNVLFEPPPAQHKPRLLARAGGKSKYAIGEDPNPNAAEAESRLDHFRGYTEHPGLALLDAGEAVEEPVLREFVKENRDRDDNREAKRRKRYERLTLSERAMLLDRARRNSRVDVSRELRLAEKMMAQAMEKIDRGDRAA
jgi:hypothetical protein